MAKRILAILALVAIAYLGYMTWHRYSAGKLASNGEIVSDDLQNSSDSSTSTGDPAPQRARPPSAARRSTAVPGSMAVPGADSLSPNAPNGATFTGKGKYQVYRQGNLTWRLDTENGQTCILFATEEEWRKPIVYSHGCNNG